MPPNCLFAACVDRLFNAMTEGGIVDELISRVSCSCFQVSKKGVRHVHTYLGRCRSTPRPDASSPGSPSGTGVPGVVRLPAVGGEKLGEVLIGLHFWSVPLSDGVGPLHSPACQHRDHQGHLVPLGGCPGMTGQVEVTLQERPLQ